MVKNEIKNLSDKEVYHEKKVNSSFLDEMYKLRKNIVWEFTTLHILWHIISIYGYMTYPFGSHKLTTLWFLLYGLYTGFGITGGIHRYWTHRTYKAKTPLRLFLAGAYYGAGMFPIRQWVKIHRIHHKYTDTDSDPHNAKRGFFYSHIGWLMQKKHPEFFKRLKEIDMSDINEDPIANFGDRHFYKMMLLLSFFIPSLVPIIFWNENWYWAFMTQTFMRYVTVLNFTSLVNSAAHLMGSKPFNKDIDPSDNRLVATLAIGEGWHNFHHVFPWDYRTGGIGNHDINVTTIFINQFAKIGWAYDLKKASDDLIMATCKKRGDGSFTNHWEEVPEPKN